MRFSYKQAQEAAKRSAAQHKKHYDYRVRYSGALHPGDRVIIRNVSLRGKQKLADRWERIRYIIISQPNTDKPVYEIKQDRNKVKKTRMLHRNLLLPFLGVPIQKQDVRGHKTHSNRVDEQTYSLFPLVDFQMIQGGMEM